MNGPLATLRLFSSGKKKAHDTPGGGVSRMISHAESLLPLADLDEVAGHGQERFHGGVEGLVVLRAVVADPLPAAGLVLAVIAQDGTEQDVTPAAVLPDAHELAIVEIDCGDPRRARGEAAGKFHQATLQHLAGGIDEGALPGGQAAKFASHDFPVVFHLVGEGGGGFMGEDFDHHPAVRVDDRPAIPVFDGERLRGGGLFTVGGLGLVPKPEGCAHGFTSITQRASLSWVLFNIFFIFCPGLAKMKANKNAPRARGAFLEPLPGFEPGTSTLRKYCSTS
jgi:hypothetical protein